MDSEIDYFRAGAQTSQQASGNRTAFSKLFPNPDSSEMSYYRDGSDDKYQDFSSAWTSPFMGDAEDFMGWPSAFGDGETTDPASDDLDGSCQIASSSSDEDSELQGSSLDHAASGQPSAPRQLLPEEGLIDIDPEEGRKRGDELFAMLMPQEAHENLSAATAQSTVSTLSAHAPAFTPPKSVPSAQTSHLPAQQRQPRQQAHSECWAAVWEGCGTAGWSSDGSGSSLGVHAEAVQQAAEDVFGSFLKEVVVANDGFLILLYESFRQYEEVMPVTAMLSRTLWPLLGREVVALDPSVAPAGHQRLALRMYEKDSQCCWEFASTGNCPRGSRCRWEHDINALSVTYIDVVY